MVNKSLHHLSGALLAFCVLSDALADAGDTFNIYLATGAQQDSNLFRQSRDEQSDTLQTTSLTLALSKPLAQQQFSLDATLVDYRFSKNDYLDYRASNYNAAWNWALTHRLTGLLSLSQTEVQNSFVDYQASTPQTRRNIARTNVNRLTAEWRVLGGWQVTGGLTNTQLVNTNTFRQQGSYELNTWELGGKYVWPAGNYLQVLRREGNGEYKDRQLIGFDSVPAPFNPQYDTAFRQNESEVRLYVPFTGKTSLTGRVARQSREHEHFSQRDYAANIGRLDFTWQPTALLSVTAGLRREVAAFQDYSSSYYLANGISLKPVWQFTPKAVLRFNYDRQERSFEGALISTATERNDILQTVSLGIDWTPQRWLTLSTAYQRDSRNSSRDSLDFKTNIFSLNARLNF